jgi:hypothetical protein
MVKIPPIYSTDAQKAYANSHSENKGLYYFEKKAEINVDYI